MEKVTQEVISITKKEFMEKLGLKGKFMNIHTNRNTASVKDEDIEIYQEIREEIK